MKILALETATELVGVAVHDDDGASCAMWATGRRRHTETLATAITQVLHHADLTVGDLDVIAVDLGPGLFTGLRVGVATAKGLAQGLGVPVLGLSGLVVLARAVGDAGHVGTVVSAIDARRGEVFVASYTVARPGTNTLLLEIDPPQVASPDALADLVRRRGADGEATVVVGDGALRYADALVDIEHVTLAGPSLAGPPPALLALLALEELHAGAQPLPAARIQPLYLRQADAQINWVQREQVRP